MSAALLLTACSSDNEGDDDLASVADGIEDLTDEDDDEAPEPDEGEGDSDGDGIDRPDIQVADTLEMIFEDGVADNLTEKMILQDNEWQIRAVYEVFTTFDRANSSVSFYTTGDALEDARAMLDRLIDSGDNETSAGTMRYFNREVEVLSETTALVNYCRDFTEVATVMIDSGEVVQEANPDAKPTGYSAFVRLSDGGVWQTVDQDAEPEAAACQ